MAIKEADQFLPINTNITKVFTVPLLRFDPIWKTRSAIVEALDTKDMKIQRLASGLFTTGVAYFANRGTSQALQEMGTTMWWEVNKDRAQLLMTNNIAGAASLLGASADVVLQAIENNDSPLVISYAHSLGRFKRGTSVVLLPLEFILNAKDNAIVNLAQLAWVGSQIRDSANDRAHIDPQNFGERALAFEAHFLREILTEDPTIPIPEMYRDIMDHYPDSIFQSLNYPTAILPPDDLHAN